MQCSEPINLYVDNKYLDKIYKKLDKKHEIAGAVSFDKFGKDGKDGKSVALTKNSSGKGTQVSTPHAVVNYHTHPIYIYQQEKTVWGWPSGDDLRECIRFGLAGNRSHLVVTVEGIYCIQVNKCKLKKLANENITDEERGFIIFLIELYFKATHNFRGVEEVNELNKHDININPYTFVDYVNKFTLGNLLENRPYSFGKGIRKEKKANTVFSNFPNSGILQYEDGIIQTLPLKSYLTDSDLHDIYNVNKYGQDHGSINKNEELVEANRLLKRKNEIISKIEGKECSAVWNNNNLNSWFYVNFYPSKAFNGVKINNKLNYYFLKNNKFVYPPSSVYKMLVSPPDEHIKIVVFSTKKSGCSMQELTDSHKELVRSKKQTSTFGNFNLSNKDKVNIYLMFLDNKRYNVTQLYNKLEDIKHVSSIMSNESMGSDGSMGSGSMGSGSMGNGSGGSMERKRSKSNIKKLLNDWTQKGYLSNYNNYYKVNQFY